MSRALFVFFSLTLYVYLVHLVHCFNDDCYHAVQRYYFDSLSIFFRESTQMIVFLDELTTSPVKWCFMQF